MAQRISRAKQTHQERRSRVRSPASRACRAACASCSRCSTWCSTRATPRARVRRCSGADLTTEAIRLTRMLRRLAAGGGRGRRSARAHAAHRRPPRRPDGRRTARSFRSPNSNATCGTPRRSTKVSRWSPARWARRPLGPYQLQAAIAAVHDEAPTAEETDWPQILALYEVLERVSPGTGGHAQPCGRGGNGRRAEGRPRPARHPGRRRSDARHASPRGGARVTCSSSPATRTPPASRTDGRRG